MPSDLGVKTCAVALCATSTAFAGYFIFFASGLDAQRSSSPETQYLASASQNQSDPITTGTVARMNTQQNSVAASSWYRTGNLAVRYKIRVTNADFYMDLLIGDVPRSIEMKIGQNIVGMGNIKSLESRNGNPYVITDRGEIASEGLIQLN